MTEIIIVLRSNAISGNIAKLKIDNLELEDIDFVKKITQVCNDHNDRVNRSG